MARKSIEPNTVLANRLILLFVFLVSCGLAYVFFSAVTRSGSVSEYRIGSTSSFAIVGDKADGGCCRGIEDLELWGSAVKWGSDFKFNTSEGCCNACKAMCTGKDGPCLCDSWVYCGNKENCGSKFGECWLKKQKDSLAPQRQEEDPFGEKITWTSGLIFGKGEGIIGFETEYGTIHIKLYPDCAPHTVAYILELLPLHHCAGCELYRAESRGQSWDSEGNHIKNAGFGPPYALIQGTLEAQGTPFHKLPLEDCPFLKRGSVALIGSGPEFFISLADHSEWKQEYTVFGSVLPEDMYVTEKIAALPTAPDVWNNVNVTVLKKPVPFLLKRINKSSQD